MSARMRLRLAHHRAVLQQAEAARLVAEEQVGRDAEVRAEHDLLVHRIDAERDRLVRRGERTGWPCQSTSPAERA